MAGNTSEELSFAENFCLSGVSAVLSKTATRPLGNIALYQQNESELLRIGHISSKLKNKSIVNCAKHIIKTDGVMGLLNGNFLNCVKFFPTQALSYGFKKHLKTMLKPKEKDSRSVILLKNITAGSMAGALSLLFIYPLDSATTLVSLGLYPNMTECIRDRGLALVGFTANFFVQL